MSVATLAVLSVVLGPVVIDAMDIARFTGFQIAATAVPTGLLATVMATRALKAKTVRGAILRTLLFCILAGIANTPASFLAVELFAGRHVAPGVEVVPGLILATLFGLGLGAPVGLVFGFGFAPFVAYVTRLRTRPSLDLIDRATVAAGLVGAGGGVASMVLESGVLRGRAVMHLLFAFTTLAGLASVAALGRLLMRRRWLARIRAGNVPGWAIVGCEQLAGTPSGLLPVASSSAAQARAVLVKERVRDGGGAYRSHEAYQPIAWVPVT